MAADTPMTYLVAELEIFIDKSPLAFMKVPRFSKAALSSKLVACVPASSSLGMPMTWASLNRKDLVAGTLVGADGLYTVTVYAPGSGDVLRTISQGVNNAQGLAFGP